MRGVHCPALAPLSTSLLMNLAWTIPATRYRPSRDVSMLCVRISSGKKCSAWMEEADIRRRHGRGRGAVQYLRLFVFLAICRTSALVCEVPSQRLPILQGPVILVSPFSTTPRAIVVWKATLLRLAIAIVPSRFMMSCDVVAGSESLVIVCCPHDRTGRS